MSINKGNIGNALHSVAPDHVVAAADDIYDETLNKYQSELNQQIGQGGYNPPQGGIPESDLSSSVQASLDKADAAVPNTRTVNGKALSSNITLNASDVGALPSSTTIPTSLSQLGDDATHRTVTDTEKTLWGDKYTKTEVNNLLVNAPDTNVVVIDNPSGVDPTTLLPSPAAPNTIYRVKGASGTSFCEYEWNGNKYVLLADRQYGIDNVPTDGSNNLVKSGGVFDSIWPKIQASGHGFIGVDTGIISPNDYWRYSDLYYVYEGLVIDVYSRISNSNLIVAYYDSEGNFLKNVSPKDAEAISTEYKLRSLVVPAGVSYVRYNSAYDANIDSYAILHTNSNVLMKSITDFANNQANGVVIKASLNGYVDKNTGVIINNEYWKHTAEFPVCPGSVFTLYNRTSEGQLLIAFYDSYGKFLKNISPISSSQGIEYETNDITIPDGVDYAIFQSASDTEQTAYCKLKSGSILENAYQNNLSKVYGTINGFIDANEGTIISNQYWRTSELFVVYEGLSIDVYSKISSDNPIIAFYDIVGNYLKDVSPKDAEASPSIFEKRNVTVPAGASYARYHSAYDALVDSYAQLSVNYIVMTETMNDIIQWNTDGMIIKPSISGYVNANTGLIVATPYWRRTSMFPVSEGAVFTLYNKVGNAQLLIAFYDADGNFLKNLSPTSSSESSVYETNDITVPNGAAYAIFHSTYDEGISAYCKLKSGSILENACQFKDTVYDYKNTLKSPINLAGKKIVFFGDSITYGIASCEPTQELPYGLYRCQNPYAKLLCENLGVDYSEQNNKAISGSRFAGTYNEIPSITSTLLAYTGGADVIYIAGGTNDYATVSEIGSVSDNTQDTLYGALNLICAHLKTNFSNATIFFALPINMSKIQSNTIPLDKYREVIYEVAITNGYYVIDCSQIGFPQKITDNGTPDFKAKTIYDGIHPTELGHKIMADVISHIISTSTSNDDDHSVVIVDSKGRGDYLNPFEAMVALKGRDTATNPITIMVMPGTYNMPTLPKDKFFSYCENRYLSIVGTDKVNCILRNDNGYYNALNSDPNNLGDNAPLKISGNVYLANLTIISTDTDNTSETEAEYHQSYCIHIDANAAEGSIMEVHNCHLKNNHAPCIGFGIPKNVTLKITDCELESDFYNPNATYGGAVIYGHDRGGSTSQIEEHVFVKNCTFVSSNGHVFKVVNNQSALMDCVFVGNACDVPQGKGIVLGSTTSINPLSFGNSINEMNRQ